MSPNVKGDCRTPYTDIVGPIKYSKVEASLQHRLYTACTLFRSSVGHVTELGIYISGVVVSAQFGIFYLL